MTQVLFFVKFAVTLWVLISLIKKMQENRSEKNFVLFVLLFFMALTDVKNMMTGDLPEEFFPQLTTLLLVMYLIYLIYMGKGSFSPWVISFMDFKNYFKSDIIEFLDESVVLVNNKTFEAIAANKKYQALIESSRSFLNAETLIMTVLKGDETLEFKDVDYNRHTIQVRLKSFGERYSLIYIKDITRVTELEIYLKDEQLYFSRLWDQAPNLIMIRKLSGEVVYVNDSMCSFLRRGPETILYRSYIDIYSFKTDSLRHQEINQTVLDKNASEGTYFLKYTHILGQTSFVELSETIIYYENEKHILTNAIDRTVEVRNELLIKSHNHIQNTLRGLSENRYVVVDFTSNMLLYREHLQKNIGESVSSFSEFYRSLDQDSQATLDAIINESDLDAAQPLTAHGKYTCIVEDLFKEQHGYPVGMLLKFIDTDESKYGLDHIGSLVLNHIKEGLLIIDFEGRIEYANEMILRILGYSKEELLNQSILSISKGLTMDLVHKNWALCRQHNSLHFERVYLDRQNNEVPVELISVLLENENTEKLVLLVYDLSEKAVYKKKMLDSQTRYTQILESIQDGVFEISLPEKKVTFFHEFDSEKGLVGIELTFLQWLNNIHDHDRSIVYEEIDLITSEKRSNAQFEYRYFQKGMWCWLRSTCKYLETDQEAMIVATNQDISEIKAVTLKLEESKHILVESERISKMAHFKYLVNTSYFNVSETFKDIFAFKLGTVEIHFEQILEKVLFSDQEYFNLKFKKFLWNDDPLDMIVRILVEGEIRYIQIRGELYKDEDDVPIYVIGTILNMTDRVYANQKLEESRALLENVVEYMPVGVMVIKKNGIVDKINKAALSLLELDEEFSRSYTEVSRKIDEKFHTLEGADVESLMMDNAAEGIFAILDHTDPNVKKRLKLTVIQMHDEDGRLQGRILTVKRVDS